ncbi:hypothetical protein D3C83_266680 [compost metagenome]
MMSANVLREASLMEPFLRRKFAPGDALEPELVEMLRGSLSALAAASKGRTGNVSSP